MKHQCCELLSWQVQNPTFYTLSAETGGNLTLGIPAHGSRADSLDCVAVVNAVMAHFLMTLARVHAIGHCVICARGELWNYSPWSGAQQCAGDLESTIRRARPPHWNFAAVMPQEQQVRPRKHGRSPQRALPLYVQRVCIKATLRPASSSPPFPKPTRRCRFRVIAGRTPGAARSAATGRWWFCASVTSKILRRRIDCSYSVLVLMVAHSKIATERSKPWGCGPDICLCGSPSSWR